MGRRVEKPHNHGTWSEAKFNSSIKSALRKMSMYWKPKTEALQKLNVGKRTNPETGRLVMFRRCESCGGDFPSKQISADHIHPVIDPNVGFVSWDNVIKRMFCEIDGFQGLCINCHDNKTNKEKAIAKERRNRDK